MMNDQMQAALLFASPFCLLFFDLILTQKPLSSFLFQSQPSSEIRNGRDWILGWKTVTGSTDVTGLTVTLEPSDTEDRSKLWSSGAAASIVVAFWSTEGWYVVCGITFVTGWM